MADPIVRVAVAGPFPQGLPYRVPRTMQQSNYVGCRVHVPLRQQDRIGIVIAVVAEAEWPAAQLKPVTEVLDATPILPTHTQALLTWMGRYYHADPMALFQLAFPKQLLQGKACRAETAVYYRLTLSGLERHAQGGKRGPKQLQVLTLLKRHGVLAKTVLQQHDVSAATLRAVLEKHWIETCEPPTETAAFQEDLLQQITLNPDQAAAVQAITDQSHQFAAFLLYGVTGSGKTEVYLRVIQQVLAQHRQVLFLVPEIGLTPQTLDRLAKRLPVPLYPMHSALSETQKRHTWACVRRGQPGVVIGTRSALFMPLPRLGLIVIDEAHDASFKQHNGIRYHARDSAVRFAQLAQVPIVLGSATPSLESWLNAERGRYQLLQLSARAGGAKMPTCHLINMHQQNIQAGLSEPLIAAMRTHLAQGNQVLLFLNRRGFASVLRCINCSWSAQCKRCDALLTIHRGRKKLCCHRCGHVEPLIAQCPQCDSTMPLQQIGVGTEKLESVLQQIFPTHTIVRIDRDQVRQTQALEQRLAQIHQGTADIIIGTQMLAKGHHFSGVTMVAIVDIDSALFSQDFRALEHLGQLLLQVSGRAGRGDLPGEMYLQTLQPDHWALRLLLKSGYTDFMTRLLAERHAAHWPPYTHLAAFVLETQQVSMAEHVLRDWVKALQAKADAAVDIYGPVPALQAKRAGFYRWQVLLQSSQRQALHRHIDQVKQHTAALPQYVRWYLDVDPYAL